MYKNPFIIAIVGLMIMTAPLFASAETISLSNLQAQIQSLLARVHVLEAQFGASSVATSSASATMPSGSCYPFGRALSMGVRGDDVSALQQFLMAKGFSIPAGATGYFGLQTKAALANWQAKNDVALSTSVGSGIFGPLSRGTFARLCGNNSTSTSTVFSFVADPESGAAPLPVTFTASTPITAGTSTLLVDFGDKTAVATMTPGSCIGIAAIVGGQGGIRCSSSVTHTYAAQGTYTAHLLRDTCPKGAQCFVGPLTIATAKVIVTSSTSATSNDIVKLNAPGTVTLSQGDIAEVRNKNVYFTLTSLTSQTATIQVTGVGCWNSFPSDVPPEIRCMIAVMPIAPQTLSVGQTYSAGSYSITLKGIADSKATFSIAASSTVQY